MRTRISPRDSDSLTSVIRTVAAMRARTVVFVLTGAVKGDHRATAFDDYREAYHWFRHNTHPDAKLMGWYIDRCMLSRCGIPLYFSEFLLRQKDHVCSFLFLLRWDYGYQAAYNGNRTTIVDNNTWNTTHIATVGLVCRPVDSARSNRSPVKL